MDRSEFEIIEELMDELRDKMEYSEDDLGERLGRPKKEVMVEIEGKGPMKDEGMDCDYDDDGMGDADEKLKRRLMKLRD